MKGIEFGSITACVISIYPLQVVRMIFYVKLLLLKFPSHTMVQWSANMLKTCIKSQPMKKTSYNLNIQEDREQYRRISTQA